MGHEGKKCSHGTANSAIEYIEIIDKMAGLYDTKSERYIRI